MLQQSEYRSHYIYFSHLFVVCWIRTKWLLLSLPCCCLCLHCCFLMLTSNDLSFLSSSLLPNSLWCKSAVIYGCCHHCHCQLSCVGLALSLAIPNFWLVAAVVIVNIVGSHHRRYCWVFVLCAGSAPTYHRCRCRCHFVVAVVISCNLLLLLLLGLVLDHHQV